MSEAELLELYRLNNDSVWSLLQWWASISFAFTAFAHFAGAKLKTTFIVCALIVYVVYSALILQIELRIVGQTEAMVQIFMQSRAAESPAPIVSVAIPAPTGLQQMLYWLAQFGLFAGTIVYVLYSHVTGRGRPSLGTAGDGSLTGGE